MFDEKIRVYGNKNIAFDDIARIFDFPVMKQPFEAAIKEVETSRFLGTYFRVKAIVKKDINTTYMDSDYDITENYITDEDGLEEVNMTLDRKQLALDWGNNLSDADYLFLEQRYAKLSQMANIEYESDVVVIRNLCQEELNLRRIREKGGNTKDAIGIITSLMQTASIRPTDIKAANAGAMSSTYGKWIDQIEENEPAEFFKDKSLYNDYDGIEKYFKDWVLRPLKNILTGNRDFNIEDK